LANRDNIQEKLFMRHVLDYCRRIDKVKYRDMREKYNLAGLIGAAHLIGFQGMLSWARANDYQRLNDPRFQDGLKTSASSYYDAFKGYLLFDLFDEKMKLKKGKKK